MEATHVKRNLRVATVIGWDGVPRSAMTWCHRPAHPGDDEEGIRCDDERRELCNLRLELSRINRYLPYTRKPSHIEALEVRREQVKARIKEIVPDEEEKS